MEGLMKYTYSKTLNTNIDETEKAVREALTEAGFGVLTEIDVSAVMKKKLDKDMKGYKILGACSPAFAYEAIQAEPEIGAMLPCNVLLRETDDGTSVSAVDPVASMQAVENEKLDKVAATVRDRLSAMIDSL